MSHAESTDASADATLKRIVRSVAPLLSKGRVADYIPALAAVDPEQFAIAVVFADGREATAGDWDTPFSIQSVVKAFMLSDAMETIGEAIFERVGREASGMSFNSLILLEQENGRPRNPLINAGAIVVADALINRDPEWSGGFLGLLQRLAGSDRVRVDETVAASEATHGDLNRAIAWFLKAKGNLTAPPDRVLEAYFRACATEMTALELARAGRFLIGGDAETGPDFCRSGDARRRIRAVMRTCGMYDSAGDFAYRVGLPAKSGVGGGVLAIAPDQYAVAVWAPGLDPKGNSLAGVRALELLTEAIGP